MRPLAAKPVVAVMLSLSLALALSACGRKGPLESPAQAAPPTQTQTG